MQGTAASPLIQGVRSQSQAAVEGNMLSSALTHKSGGRMRLPARQSPEATSFMHRRKRRIQVLSRWRQTGFSSSPRFITTGGAGNSAEDTTGAAAVGSALLRAATGRPASSLAAASACARNEKVGLRLWRGTLSSLSRSPCGSAEPIESPHGTTSGSRAARYSSAASNSN